MIRFLSRQFVVFAALAALASTGQAAGDPAAGKAKFETCSGCHAIAGYTNAYPTYHVPRLGGQHADYVVLALKAYQNSERWHPTMHANATPLSEQEMQDIAAYLSSFKTAVEPNPTQGDVAAGKKKSASCAACHGPDGNGPITQYPRLAGQYEDYLHQALQDYKTGKRNNPVMKGMVTPLSDQDIADLSAYFASQARGLIVVQHE